MSSVFKSRFCSFVETANLLWFSECNYNALLCIDRTDGKIRKIVMIPDDDIRGRDLYSCIFKIDNDLILVPNRSNRIVCYHIDNDSFSSIFIDEYVKVSLVSNYKAACQWGSEIIMLPNRADKIIIYNHLERKILTIEIKSDDLDKLYPNRVIQFRPQFEIIDDYLLIPFLEVGAILKINLSTKETEIILVEGLSGCDTINYYDGIFYLASWSQKKIYALNMNFNIIEEYTEYPTELEADKLIFAYSLLTGEKIVYFPLFGNMIISFDMRDRTIKEERRIYKQNVNYNETHLAEMRGEKMIALMEEDIWLAAFFYSSGVLNKKPYCLWDACYNNKIIKNYLTEHHYFSDVYESNGVGLRMLTDILEGVGNDVYAKEKSSQVETVGEHIYWCVSGGVK